MEPGDTVGEGHEAPVEGRSVGGNAAHELTVWVATGTAAAIPEINGPRIQPEECTIAPGVFALMGSGALGGAFQPVAAAGGVVQLVATGEVCIGLPHAAAGGGDGAAIGLPQAEAGALGAAEATMGVGATATGDGGATVTAGVGAGTVARGRALVVAERRDAVDRDGVPAIGIIGATAGSATGTTAAGNEGATGDGSTTTGTGAPLSATAWPPVRRPDERCDALPETDMNPPSLATLQLKDKERLSPAMDPLPDRSVKFIRMLRTESVNVHR